VLPKRGRPPGLLKTSYDKGTAEFNRVTSLSDAVFAIAMTLLVLTLDIPDVTGAGLARALADQLTQFIAFLLSFILVAIIWVQHHSFMAKLGRLEPVLIGLNLALLGVVVAVPYPTNLIGGGGGCCDYFYIRIHYSIAALLVDVGTGSGCKSLD